MTVGAVLNLLSKSQGCWADIIAACSGICQRWVTCAGLTLQSENVLQLSCYDWICEVLDCYVATCGHLQRAKSLNDPL